MQMRIHSELYVNQNLQRLLLFPLEKALLNIKILHYFLQFVTGIYRICFYHHDSFLTDIQISYVL